MEKRNIGIYVLLSIVTCGVFSIYWIYCIGNDLYRLNGEESKAGTDILLGFVTCGFYFFYVYYMYGKKLNDIRIKYGASPKDDSVILVVFAIFTGGIVSECILQHSLNEEIIPLVYGGSGRDDQYHNH